MPRSLPRPRGTALLVLAALCAVSLVGCGDPPPRPVILLTVDTLRADAVGLFGGQHVETPQMDGIGRDGAIIERTFVPTPRTTQSVGTILTGLHPLTHGADGLGMQLTDDVTSIAEVFRANGYRTAAFVTNINLAPGRGFEQGFDLYSNPENRWKGNSAEDLTSEAIAWLESRNGDEPFFLWIHYLDPHWPYTPPAEFARRADPEFADRDFDITERQERGDVSKGQIIYEARSIMTEREIEHVRRLYAAEVGATDEAIGRLFEALERLELRDEVLLTFTSDHGESLGEHDYWFAHGEYLYEGGLRVPWMVRAPGLVPEGTRIGGVTLLADVAPTVLGLSGLPIPPLVEGRDLSPFLRGEAESSPGDPIAVHVGDWRHIHPENPRHPVEGREGRWTALREGDLKLIRVPMSEEGFDEELYDLADDPGETRNLVDERPDDVARLRERLGAELADFEPLVVQDAEAPDEEELDALRSLGYVD